jgi:hypothetical protein
VKEITLEDVMKKLEGFYEKFTMKYLAKENYKDKTYYFYKYTVGDKVSYCGEE